MHNHVPMYVFMYHSALFQPHTVYLPTMLCLFTGNTIRFEKASYRTTESVGNFTDVRLVADQPFAEDTSVSISSEDITAISVCSLQAYNYITSLFEISLSLAV